jgi:hypothetical protein
LKAAKTLHRQQTPHIYSFKDKWNEDIGEELGVADINTVIKILRKKFLETTPEHSIHELI